MTSFTLPRRGVRVAASVAAALALTLTGAPGSDAHGSHDGGSRGGDHWGGEHWGAHGGDQSGRYQDDHREHGRHPHGAFQRVLADGLISPLRAAVAHNGAVYVSQNFVGKLTKVRPGRAPRDVYTDPNGNEVGGVSVRGKVVTFTVTKGTEQSLVDSWLKKLYPDGSVRTVADVRAYENAHNPDSRTTYGFRKIDPACAAKWPTADNGPATYTGLPDSHPYATYALPGGWTYIADAGANAVFLVSPRGRIRTVAVLPAIPYTLTADDASGLGLDSCFAKKTYWFEPVPTDIEVGRGGQLYVPSLPGGPEGDELGARGSVFTINPWSGRVRRVVAGLLGPTGLAVGRRHTLYVAQMFGNEIAKVKLGRHGAVVKDFLHTAVPAEVEWTPRGLYFTDHALPAEDAPPAGRLVRLARH